MNKTFLMLLGFAVVLAAGVACFGLSSKEDKTSPLNSPRKGTGRLEDGFSS